MRIKGIDGPEDIDAAIDTVNRNYGGNVALFDGSVTMVGKFYLFRLGVRDSSGPGAARSWKDRRSVYACWHVWRDVIAALFAAYPDATMRGGLTPYDGAAGFLRDFRSTGHRNVGSMMEPKNIGSACKCQTGTRDGVSDGPIVTALREQLATRV